MVRQLLLDQFGGVVAGAVIHHNDFERAGVVLLRDAFDGANDIVLLVIGGNENTHPWVLR